MSSHPSSLRVSLKLRPAKKVHGLTHVRVVCRLHTCARSWCYFQSSDEASRNVHENYFAPFASSPAASFGHIAEAARPPSARLHLVRVSVDAMHLTGQLFFRAALQPRQETSDGTAQCPGPVKASYTRPTFYDFFSKAFKCLPSALLSGSCRKWI